MEVTLCLEYDESVAYNAFFSSGTILFYPESLAAQLNATASAFQHGIVHVDCPLIDLCDRVYAKISGRILYRDPKFHRTCVIHFTSEHVHSIPKTICIARISKFEWTDNDDVVSFLGLVECRIRLHDIQWRFYSTEDREFVAVPHHLLDAQNDHVKTSLSRLFCRFQVNVSFTDERETRTRRSILFPSAILGVTPIERISMKWGIAALRPHPVLYFESREASHIFGCTSIGLPLSDVWSRSFDGRSCEYLNSRVLPCLIQMNHNDQMVESFRTITIDGMQNITYTFHKVRCCVICFMDFDTTNSVLDDVDDSS